MLWLGITMRVLVDHDHHTNTDEEPEEEREDEIRLAEDHVAVYICKHVISLLPCRALDLIVVMYLSFQEILCK